VDDAAAWALLALVIGIVAANTPVNAIYIILMTLAFTLLMLLAVRPLLARLFDRGVSSEGELSEWVVVVILGLVCPAFLHFFSFYNFFFRFRN
jgi:Kef-type K+ transport system membrane component KefB